MDLLVTGSAGQIGSYVVDRARTKGLRVAGLDLRESAWTSHVGDVRHPPPALIERGGAVVHCAAQVSVRASVEDPRSDADHNVLGTIAMLDAARRRDAGRFVFVSSAAVYGAPVAIPIPETHPRAPLSPYGASKSAGEDYVATFRRLYGLDAIVVRPFNVFSARQDPSNPYAGVIARFAERARARKPLMVFGRGDQTRDFVHAADVAAWLVDIANPSGPIPDGETLNLATGVETSVLDLARAFCGFAGNALPIDHAPSAPGDIGRSLADVSRARKYGLQPVTRLESGLAALVGE